MEKAKITIVGAGVIGLAIAQELSETFRDIFMIEKNPSFGQETSSRNSEVIHSGMHYTRSSLKHSRCVEGNTLLYEFCVKHNVAFKKLGKLTVASDKNEIRSLELLFQRGTENGVEGLALLSKDEIKKIEPNIKAEAAIYSPSTGIIDSHGFMKVLARKFLAQNGAIVYQTEVTGLEAVRGGFIVTSKTNRDVFKFFTDIVINCAGLSSDRIAAMAAPLRKEYELKYCKGDYFRVSAAKAKLVNRLVYPVPRENDAGLGIHATPDLSGGLRLGPDSEYINRENLTYDVDLSKKTKFYKSAHTFLPFLFPEDLSPDTAGIRPKLQGQGETFRDFLIEEESRSRGLINLIGIESPGFTSALSIARMVKKIVGGLASKN